MYDEDMEMSERQYIEHAEDHMHTPNKHKKKTLYPGAFPTRRLFSQNVSPQRGGGMYGANFRHGGIIGPSFRNHYSVGQEEQKQNKTLPTKAKR